MTKLAIYISEDCWTCAESRRIAVAVAEDFPEVEVTLVDLNDGPSPAQVFAAPTYLLDGKVIYLGNPRREELWQRLRTHPHPEQQRSIKEAEG